MALIILFLPGLAKSHTAHAHTGHISACAIAIGPVLKIWAIATHVQIYVITHNENPSTAPCDTVKFGKFLSIMIFIATNNYYSYDKLPGVGESKLQP